MTNWIEIKSKEDLPKEGGLYMIAFDECWKGVAYWDDKEQNWETSRDRKIKVYNKKEGFKYTRDLPIYWRPLP